MSSWEGHTWRSLSSSMEEERGLESHAGTMRRSTGDERGYQSEGSETKEERPMRSKQGAGECEALILFPPPNL